MKLGTFAVPELSRSADIKLSQQAYSPSRAIILGIGFMDYEVKTNIDGCLIRNN
jgi:hypothetical protein